MAALLRSPPLVVRDDLTYFYCPLPLCQSSVGADELPSTDSANKRGERSNAALVGTRKADNIRSRRKLLKAADTQAKRHPQGVCRIRKAAKLPTAAQQRR